MPEFSFHLFAADGTARAGEIEQERAHLVHDEGVGAGEENTFFGSHDMVS